MKTWIFAALALLATGCYQKHLILQAEVVSMTRADSGTAKLAGGHDIDEKWCMGDEPAYKKGSDKDYGLADQVIYKAQGGGKRADYITNVRVYRDSDGCALLSGKGVKL